MFIAGFEGGDGVCEIGLCIHFPSNELEGFDEHGNGGCGGVKGEGATEGDDMGGGWMKGGWYELEDGDGEHEGGKGEEEHGGGGTRGGGERGCVGARTQAVDEDVTDDGLLLRCCPPVVF